MKVKKETQLGLMFRDKDWRSPLEKQLKERHFDPKYSLKYSFQHEQRIYFFNKYFKDEFFKDFLLSEKVKKIATKIKLHDKFNYSFLGKAKNTAATYLIDKHRFFRYYIEDGFIYIFHLKMTPVPQGMYTNYNTFRINLTTGEILDDNPESYKIAEEFARLMIFIELSDVDYTFVKPKQKIGNKSYGYKNDSKLPFMVIDTSWNQVSVRTQGFAVKGHFRVQPCGKELKDRKLIWIDGFEKQGYTRKRKH